VFVLGLKADLRKGHPTVQLGFDPKPDPVTKEMVRFRHTDCFLRLFSIFRRPFNAFGGLFHIPSRLLGMCAGLFCINTCPFHIPSHVPSHC
jgi:hypothetical protein